MRSVPSEPLILITSATQVCVFEKSNFKILISRKDITYEGIRNVKSPFAPFYEGTVKSLPLSVRQSF